MILNPLKASEISTKLYIKCEKNNPCQVDDLLLWDREISPRGQDSL